MKYGIALIALLALVGCTVGTVDRNGADVVATFTSLAGPDFITTPATQLSTQAAKAAANACGIPEPNAAAGQPAPERPEISSYLLTTALSRAKAIYEWWPRNRIIVAFSCNSTPN